MFRYLLNFLGYYSNLIPYNLIKIMINFHFLPEFIQVKNVERSITYSSRQNARLLQFTRYSPEQFANLYNRQTLL